MPSQYLILRRLYLNLDIMYQGFHTYTVQQECAKAKRYLNMDKAQQAALEDIDGEYLYVIKNFIGNDIVFLLEAIYRNGQLIKDFRRHTLDSRGIGRPSSL